MPLDPTKLATRLSRSALEALESVEAMDDLTLVQTFLAELGTRSSPAHWRHIPGVPYDAQRDVFLPETPEQVRMLVLEAREQGWKVRAAGAEHSRERAVFSERARDLRMLLSGALRHVQIEPIAGTTEARVHVGGGCYLGRNPMDPYSNEQNSLNFQLDEAGYALPVLGGMSHQSIAGFLLTGSAGGSLRYGIADVVEEITLVDGRGDLHTLQKGEEHFNAAAISMGLFGVVVSVTLRVGRHYHVEGNEQTLDQDDSCLIPETSQGRNTYRLLRQALDEDYFHMNWFPQKYVRRVMEWRGSRREVAPPVQPYKHALAEPGRNELAAVALFLASTLLAIDSEGDFVHRRVGELLRRFVPIEEKLFKDLWYKTLPVDDQADIDNLIKTHFTEIWLPLEQLDRALDILHELYNDQKVAGNFACEIYGAAASPYWLSPAYGRPVVLIDPYWWAHNAFGTPSQYFTAFWNRLLGLEGARLHWGKYVPEPGQRLGNVTFDLAHLRSRYPRLDDWLRLRDVFDPEQIFVSSYWRAIFAIPS